MQNLKITFTYIDKYRDLWSSFAHIAHEVANLSLIYGVFWIEVYAKNQLFKAGLGLTVV